MPGRNEQQLLGNAIVNSQFLSRLRDHCARHDGAKICLRTRPFKNLSIGLLPLQLRAICLTNPGVLGDLLVLGGRDSGV